MGFQRIIESSQNIKTKASVVQLLLNANANVNATDTHGIFGDTGVTGIWMASQAGHVDVVREFIKAKADVNVTDTENGMTSLRAAFLKATLTWCASSFEARPMSTRSTPRVQKLVST